MKIIGIYLNFAVEKLTMWYTVTLKDGSRVPQVTFYSVQKKLLDLKAESFGTLIDLIEKCRDEKFQFQPNVFQDSAELLKKRHLMHEDGRIHPFVKAIVLNAFEGKGLETKFNETIRC